MRYGLGLPQNYNFLPAPLTLNPHDFDQQTGTNNLSGLFNRLMDVAITYNNAKLWKNNNMMSYQNNQAINTNNNNVVTKAKLEEMISNLHEKVRNYQSQKQSDLSGLENEVLKICRKPLFIQIHEKANENNDALFNLYLTVNTVFNIVRDDETEESLDDRLNQFFKVREKYLKNDSHDYCFKESYANTFCKTLAEQMSGDHPANVIYQGTLAARDYYEDVFTAESDLPNNFKLFFRTEENFFHVYESILARALVELKRGKVQMSEIWMGSDIAIGERPLRTQEIFLLKQRTPTFKTLIDYTERLADLAEGSKNTLYQRLLTFRQELRKGDAHGGTGQNRNAGDSAYIAVANFSSWLNSLEPEYKEKVYAINKGELGRIFTIILDAFGKHEVQSCIYVNGHALENVLANSSVQTEIYALDKQINWRKTHEELDEIKRIILEVELLQSPVIDTGYNLFDLLASNENILQLCEDNPNVDLMSLGQNSFIIDWLMEGENITVQEADRKFALLNFFMKNDALTDEMQGKILYVFVDTKHYDAAKKILQDNPEYKVHSGENAPFGNALHRALHNGVRDQELITLLMRDKSALSQSDGEGQTPVSLAVKHNFPMVVNQFLDHCNEFSDQQSGEIIHELLEKQCFDDVQEILIKKPDAAAYSRLMDCSSKTFKEIFRHKAFFESLTQDPNVFLHRKGENSILTFALQNEKYEMYDNLISKYNDKFTQTELGEALLLLITNDENKRAIELLEKRPDTDLTIHNERQHFAIHLAVHAKKPNVDLIKLLSKSETALHVVDRNDETVLEVAAHRKKYNVVKYLIDNHRDKFSQIEIRGAQHYLKKSRHKEIKNLIPDEKTKKKEEEKKHHIGFFKRLRNKLSCRRTEKDQKEEKTSSQSLKR